jgi:hypothetical protein
MAEPVDASVRAARPSGLTSPNPVRTPTPQGKRPQAPAQEPRTSCKTVSSRQNTPEDSSWRESR